MSISNLNDKSRTTANGSVQDFSIPHDIVDSADNEVEVYLVDESVSPATETLQVEASDYTLTGGPPVTTVHFASAPAANLIVFIRRKLSLTQPTSFSTSGAYPAASHELALDRLLAQIQQLREQISRAFKLRISTALSDIQLPEPTAYASFRWNSSKTALENVIYAVLQSTNSVSDNQLVRWDGATGTYIQGSAGVLDDSGNLTGLSSVAGGNLTISGNTLSSTDTNGNINLTPNGTGLVKSAAKSAWSAAMAVGQSTAAAASAILELVSTSQGFLPPRMTTAQRTAIGSPAEGLVVYDTDFGSLFWHDAAGWNQAAVGAVGNDAAGSAAIANGADTVSATYNTPFPDNLYRVIPAIRNVTDSDPQILSWLITAKDQNGFTIKLNAPVDSGNYVMDYHAARDV